MSKELEDRQEWVRKLLKEAFADVPCPDSFREADACGPVIHDVCLELRHDFYNYEPEEIQYMLPYVLEDLIDTRTGDDIETGDAEFLIMQLNPLRSDSEIVCGVQLKQFASFTREQSLAICEWLQLARTWNDLRLFVNEVEAACRRIYPMLVNRRTDPTPGVPVVLAATSRNGADDRGLAEFARFARQRRAAHRRSRLVAAGPSGGGFFVFFIA